MTTALASASPRHWGRMTALLVVGLCASWSAAQQTFFVVTSLSRGGQAIMEAPDAEPRAVEVAGVVAAGVLRVQAGTQVMLYNEPGIAAVLIGPAELELIDETDRRLLHLRNGRLLFDAAELSEEVTLEIWIPAPDAVDGEPRLEFVVAPGRIIARRDGQGASVAFLPADPTAAAEAWVGDDDYAVGANQRVTLAAGGQVAVAAYTAEADADLVEAVGGRGLGVASARAARAQVEDRLFKSIIAWDQYAAARYVAARIETRRFQPEIRQTVQAITRSSRSSSRSSRPQIEGIAGANQVPIVSPAALSVQNFTSIAEGVTAVRLNQQAGELLSNTASQGLGFGGLSRLSISGLNSSGGRSVGPAGLGASPN